MNETLRNTVNIDPGLMQFINNYDVVSADEDLQKEYNSYAQGLLYFTGVRRMAYEEGIDQGSENTKLLTAKNMLRDGMNAEKVAEYTELPLEKVKNIQNSV
ncbi:MAG: hypothetical protein LBL87_08090 [Ruminococcus sp.]|nr:hypothetical protein [Ruminococcus sp.]